MKSMYPTWRYHAERKPEGLIVYSEEQELALGSGWVDTPAAFKKVILEGPSVEPAEPKAPNSISVIDGAPASAEARTARKRGGRKA